jgi:amino acid permease
MKEPQDQDNELQSIWQRNDAPQSEEEITMDMKLLQEKRRSLHDFVQGGSSNNYLLVLSFAPLFALGIWKTRQLALMQIGNLIVMVVLLAGALATWLYQRSERRLDQVDLNMRDFQRLLLHFIDRSIAFSKGIKFWFAPALFFGIALAAYPVLNRFWSPALCIAALSSVFVCFEYSVWKMEDLRRVRELQRRKNEVESLLKEMDECR